MNYTEALERAKSTPVMRPHWKNYWITYNDGNYFTINDEGALVSWYALKHELVATDWIEAPKPADEF